MPSQVVEIERAIPGAAIAPSRVRRASWGAIFAGVFVALIIQVILTVLGVAIGLTSFHPAQPQGLKTFGTASGIWLLVSGLIATWIGAWVAGRLSGGPLRTDGMVHGIVAWSVACVTSFLIMASALGAALGSFGAAFGGAAGPLANLWGQAGAAPTEQAGESHPGSNTLAPTGRNEVAPPANANNISTSDVAQGAWWVFVVLILGLLFAIWGGWAGAASLPIYDATIAQAAAPTIVSATPVVQR